MAKKSEYSQFINFFFNSLNNRIIHYFLGPHYSLFINFLAHYSLFIIKKGHYSLIIIPHPDPHFSHYSLNTFPGCRMDIKKIIIKEHADPGLLCMNRSTNSNNQGKILFNVLKLAIFKSAQTKILRKSMCNKNISRSDFSGWSLVSSARVLSDFSSPQ